MLAYKDIVVVSGGVVLVSSAVVVFFCRDNHDCIRNNDNSSRDKLSCLYVDEISR